MKTIKLENLLYLPTPDRALAGGADVERMPCAPARRISLLFEATPRLVALEA